MHAEVLLGRGRDRASVRSNGSITFGGPGNDRIRTWHAKRAETIAVGGPAVDRCRALVVRGCER